MAVADASETMPIRSRYAEQFAADSEANRKEQEGVSAQITELQERLKQLKADEILLSDMQRVVAAAAEQQDASAVLETDTPAEAASQAVPPPRQETRTQETATASRAKKTARSKGPGKVARSAPKKTVAKTGDKKSAEPPLSELVLGLLLVHAGEPRLTREVHADLEAAHPTRATTLQTVRNSLDALAKKGVIEKEKKQGSAMYTAPKTAEVTPPSETAVEDLDEKVPATA
ncbi:hypothetical protein [Streptomyces sp. NPDC056661]|uniref:hypothetical protein n=1 Tax=Streptomyces sp. NPDC056661 TaxID=3345898 RepID=UPI003683C429